MIELYSSVPKIKKPKQSQYLQKLSEMVRQIITTKCTERMYTILISSLLSQYFYLLVYVKVPYC